MRNTYGYDSKLADIIYEFVDFKNKGVSPDLPEVKQTVKKWQKYMSENHYECSDELLEALGAMYRGDDFKDKIDVFSKGTALYMSMAISAYCKDKK